jgi:hypothetical protein
MHVTIDFLYLSLVRQMAICCPANLAVASLVLSTSPSADVNMFVIPVSVFMIIIGSPCLPLVGKVGLSHSVLDGYALCHFWGWQQSFSIAHCQSWKLRIFGNIVRSPKGKHK